MKALLTRENIYILRADRGFFRVEVSRLYRVVMPIRLNFPPGLVALLGTTHAKHKIRESGHLASLSPFLYILAAICHSGRHVYKDYRAACLSSGG